MHPYSIESSERHRVPMVLATIAVLIVYGLSTVVQRMEFALPWWLSLPSVFGVYGLCYLLFDHWLWRTTLLRILLGIRTPDLSGSWKSNVEPAGDSFSSREANVEIRQTWTKLIVTLETEASRSKSVVAAIAFLTPQRAELVYEYSNEPKAGAVDSMHAHRGLARLVCTGEDEMEGEYFTGRDRGTYGALKLVRVVTG